jgi:hypothetical protein
MRIIFAFSAMAPLGVTGCHAIAETPGAHGPHAGAAVSHLVIDSGSSGTRFCLFDTVPNAASGTCFVGASKAICGKTEGGLAALALGASPSQVSAIITPKLEAAWSALEVAVRSSGRDSSMLANVSRAAALGTGGYRNASTGEPEAKPEWAAVWTFIDGFLRSKGIRNVVTKALTGAEEANLAWAGVREFTGETAPFAIVDIGGSTTQVASGTSGERDDERAAISVKAGQSVTFAVLEKEPGFSVCYAPTDAVRQNSVQCTALIRRSGVASNALAAFVKGISSRTLYGVGASWTGTLTEFPNAPPWLPKVTADVQPRVTLDNLRALAARVCSLSNHDLIAFAPKAFAVRHASGRACFSLAFEVAVIESLGDLPAHAEIAAGGDDQWARGASISGAYFADCKAPKPNATR